MILQVMHMIYILLSISVRFFLFNSLAVGRCGQKLILDPGIQYIFCKDCSLSLFLSFDFPFFLTHSLALMMKVHQPLVPLLPRGRPVISEAEGQRSPFHLDPSGGDQRGEGHGGVSVADNGDYLPLYLAKRRGFERAI